MKGDFGVSPYYPAVGLYFQVKVAGFQSKVDLNFQEVSGINVEFDTGVTIKEGGENRFQIALPGRTKYPDLVLKRGLISAKSDLATWCQSTVQSGYSKTIKPKGITIILKDQDGKALMTWSFHKAYPKKIEVSGFNSQGSGSSAIVVQTLTLAYQYFEVVKS